MFLELHDVHVHYGKIEAVKGVNLELGKGEIITLIGANGAGKTTILKTISGLVRSSAGQISYDGQRIDRLASSEVVAKGIAHVPEGRRLFKLMTVEENLVMGAYRVRGRDVIAKGLDAVYRHFPILRDKRRQLAEQLSGGQQQMVAIGRAMMARPRLMLMDEPSLGLSPIMINEIAGIINMLRDSGLSIVLVEQNAMLALKLAERGYVLETGSIALQGPSAQLLNDPHVARAYLGA
jgi:branched-chain amino acid transport system ATP-binding protein